MTGHWIVCYESPDIERICWALLARSQASNLYWLITDDSFTMSLSNCKQQQKHQVSQVSKIFQFVLCFFTLHFISCYSFKVIKYHFTATAPAAATTMLTHLYAFVWSKSHCGTLSSHGIRRPYRNTVVQYSSTVYVNISVAGAICLIWRHFHCSLLSDNFAQLIWKVALPSCYRKGDYVLIPI